MITLSFYIKEDETIVDIDLPEKAPPVNVIIKATMSCQFDSVATNTITEKIREQYGEEYFKKIMQAMSEVMKTFRDIVQNSMSLDADTPAVPVVYLSPRGQK